MNLKFLVCAKNVKILFSVRINIMETILSTTHPVAKKHHQCDACTWLLNGGYPDGMTISEWRSIVKAKRNKWKIVPGQKYIRQSQMQDGEFVCFKAIPEIDEICRKYDVYEDYC